MEHREAPEVTAPHLQLSVATDQQLGASTVNKLGHECWIQHLHRILGVKILAAVQGFGIHK